MRLIGFTHGCTFKIMDVYSKENIELFTKCGCTAIEVNCHSVEEVEKLPRILQFVKYFEYVSVHFPCNLRYKDDVATHTILDKVVEYYKLINAKLAVIHPDLVDDWSVFDKYTDVNWAIENMDDRKTSFKTVLELENFFEDHPSWSFVLDVGHCNANDKTMQLAKDFIGSLGNKIKEIHMSGYEVFHEPLHRTGQKEIIESCKELNVPIIIESTFEDIDGTEGVEKELEYIVKNLGK
jgi:hypothetical protein